MEDKNMAWPGPNNSSGYELPPPFTPGAESWGPPPQNSNPGDIWGGPMYGGPPPSHPAHMQQLQQLQQYQLGHSFNSPGLWTPGAMYDGPPPMNPQGGMPVHMGRGGPRGAGRGSMPVYNHFDYNQNPNRGGPKPARGGGRGRGRGAMSAPPVNVNPEFIQKVRNK